MQQLKIALGKDKQNHIQKSKSSFFVQSDINKSKSESMWVFEDDSEQLPNRNISQNLNNSTSFLENKIMELFKKDKKITQNAFDRILEQFQQQIGEGKTQISYLLVIQDKLTDLTEDFTGQKKKFFEEFISLVEQKIAQIRKREKKNQLLQFDKIVQNNFKKKLNAVQIQKRQKTSQIQQNHNNNFLGLGQIKQREKSASKSRQKSKNKQKSSEKPLNKFLIKQKLLKKQKLNQMEENLNQTHSQSNQESISFSAVMSASCAVKQRNRLRRNTKKKIQLQIHDHQKDEEGEQDGQKAFVFYRPKKGK